MLILNDILLSHIVNIILRISHSPCKNVFCRARATWIVHQPWDPWTNHYWNWGIALVSPLRAVCSRSAHTALTRSPLLLLLLGKVFWTTPGKTQQRLLDNRFLLRTNHPLWNPQQVTICCKKLLCITCTMQNALDWRTHGVCKNKIKFYWWPTALAHVNLKPIFPTKRSPG